MFLQIGALYSAAVDRCLSFLVVATLVAAAACRSEPLVSEGLREINGTQLFVASYGTGEPIVVVHGGPGFDHSYFLPRLADLASDRRVIFYDQRASGRSSADVPADTVSLDNFMADLDGIRESFGLERMHLLGHSFGGMLAMQYAIRYPERVRSLMLVNSTAASSEYLAQVNQTMMERMTPANRERRNELMQSEGLQNREPAAVEEFLRILLSANFHDPEAVARLSLYVPEDIGPRSELLQGLQGDLATYDIHDRLSLIRSPTLIVRGASEALPRDATERIQAGIPDSRQIELEDCGHFPFVECPDALTEALQDFLDQVE